MLTPGGGKRAPQRHTIMAPVGGSTASSSAVPKPAPATTRAPPGVAASKPSKPPLDKPGPGDVQLATWRQHQPRTCPTARRALLPGRRPADPVQVRSRSVLDPEGGDLRVVPGMILNQARLQIRIPVGLGLEENLPLLSLPNSPKCQNADSAGPNTWPLAADRSRTANRSRSAALSRLPAVVDTRRYSAISRSYGPVRSRRAPSARLIHRLPTAAAVSARRGPR